MGRKYVDKNKKMFNKLTGTWGGIERIRRKLSKGDYIFYRDKHNITIERVSRELDNGNIILYNKYGEWEITRDEVIAVKMRGWL